VAQLYGVPIGYRDHKTGKTLSHRQAMENLAALKAATKPKPFKQKRVPMKNPAPSPPPQPAVPAIPLSSGEVGTSFSITGGQPTGGTLIMPSTQPVDRQAVVEQKIIYALTWVAIMVVWITALLISPYILVGVLPFFLVQHAALRR